MSDLASSCPRVANDHFLAACPSRTDRQGFFKDLEAFAINHIALYRNDSPKGNLKSLTVHPVKMQV